ncbi:D-aminoacyl-tRNA deacylase [Flavobacteriaceae bacterium]|jgi:D-tyrosyl-tRNA(Tyr) deacylase|nr:D-aminoacyl-tRNA deacylase [Flavobacteriaceae bacterium]MDA9036141.1 D-aminoacyl-tRNA deacylase [Flavobacteriaceae bacterium]MDA9250139.1 D-aminoacyl-tRNA deacylase [Flavobacteriaceae bacterium]|tara:strand:+ start:17216 stop:17668 length:453 start_codon:yes stop_codon:yes gene_type:complete
MRIVIQRVLEAEVKVEGVVKGAISQGLMVLLGIETTDTDHDIDWLVNKLVNLRIFNDSNGVMNQSLLAIEGELLVISQFTLMAASKKGNRPSYIRAAKHEIAIPLYEKFLRLSELKLGKKVASGVFGADMKLGLINDGPVTLILDSKNRE